MSPSSQDVSRLADLIARLALYAIGTVRERLTLDNVVGFISGICSGAPLGIGDFALSKTLEAFWDRIERWARKRELAKTIRGLYLYRSANRGVRKSLDKIPKLIQSNASRIRKELEAGRSFVEIVEGLLADTDDIKLPEDYAKKLPINLQHAIFRVVASGVKLPDVYSFLIGVGMKNDEISQAIELLRATLQSNALARELVDLSFSTRLERIEVTLDCDALTAEQNESLLQDRTAPEPTFFRRPHLNWVDLERGYYYDRSKLVDDIEDKFAQGRWLQLIVAPSGAGKTTLGLIIGYRHLTLYGGIAYYVNLEDRSDVDLARDVGEIAKALKRIRMTAGSRRGNDEEDLADYDSASVEEIPSILVIVDNIHLNLGLVKDLIRSVRSAYVGTDLAAALSILLLARVGHEDLQRGTEQILAELFDSRLGRRIAGTHTLEKRDFKDAVRGIAEVFARERNIGDIKSFERDLVRRSQESLWLLSFVLRGLEKGRSIEEIDLCEEVEKFYYCEFERSERINSVFHRVLHTRASENGLDLGRLEPADARGALRAVLTTIAALGTLGTPMPKKYLIEAAERYGVPSDIAGGFLEGEEAKAVVEEMIERLRTLNEIVDGEMAGEQTVRLPHTTLAEVVWSCAVKTGRPSILAEESRDDDTSIAAHDMRERIVLSLLDWCAGYGIVDKNGGPGLLPQVIRQAILENFWTWNLHVIANWFREGEDLQRQPRLSALAIALENYPGLSILDLPLFSSGFLPDAWESLFKDAFLVADRPGLVLYAIKSFFTRRPTILEVEARIDDLCAEIAQTQESKTVLSAISPFLEIRKNERIVNAIAMVLRSHPEPWEILYVISDWYDVRSDPKIVVAISEAILSHPEPWKILEPISLGIIEWPEVSGNSKVINAIAEALRSHPRPWWILYAISDWDEVRDDPEIDSAVGETAIPRIAEAIRSSFNPWLILHRIVDWSKIQANPDVRAAIDEVAETICEDHRWGLIPDWVWENIVKIPQLRQHECIRRFLSE